MTDWNHNMAEAPLDRPLLLAGKAPHITKSKWLPSGKERKVGRWEAFSEKDRPVAWMLWPSHPDEERA